MSEYTNGYIEGQNRKGLQPASLYEAQRAVRGISTGLMPETGREDIPHIIVETNRCESKIAKRCMDIYLHDSWKHGTDAQIFF